MKKLLFSLFVLLMITSIYLHRSNNQNIKVNQEYTLVYNVMANDEANFNFADYPKVILDKGDTVIVKAINGNFVEVEAKGELCWINDWYITAKSSVKLIDNEIKYALAKTSLNLIPEEGVIVNYDEIITKGKVVVIRAEYEEWYCINILRYSEPMYDNYWVQKDAVGIVSDELIKEGNIKPNSELLTLSGENILDENCSIIVVEEYNDEYFKFESAGGIAGLVKKSDFLPIKSFDDLYTFE